MTHACKTLLAVFVFAAGMPMDSLVAQVCTGNASFTKGRVQVALNFGSTPSAGPATEGGTPIGAQIKLGTTRAFATVGGSLVLLTSESHFVRKGLAAQSADDAGAIVAAVSAGYAIPIVKRAEMELCPIAGYSWQRGPSMWRTCRAEGAGTSCADEVAGRAQALWLGGALGRNMRLSPDLVVVPFGSAVIMRSVLTGDGGQVTETLTENFVGISAGVGLTFDRLTVRPLFSFPVGLEGGRGRRGLELAYSLGARASARP